MREVTFGNPVWFWAFALLPLLALLYWRGEVLRRRALGLLVSPRLQPRLAGRASVFRRRLSFLLTLGGLACVFLALTQPRLGVLEERRPTVGRDIIFAIDTSRSMLANDLTPTRLARTKLATEDLLGKLHGDRVGLIAFAGNAFLQAPLTVDYPAVSAALQEFDTAIIPVGGTNIAAAIRCATDAFGKGDSDQHALIIITDGEELEESGVEAARKAAPSMRIFTVGVGSPEGTVIAIPGVQGGTDYLKSPDGQIVKSSLDEPRLRDIAEVGGGFYLHLRNGPAEMQTILRDGLDAMSRHQAENLVTRRPRERYRWPLAAGLLLLAGSMFPGERRRRPVAAALGLALLFALPAQARNNGLEAYDKGDFPSALGSFEKQLEQRPASAPLQFDSGTAAYRTGDYDKALDYFSKALTTREPALRQEAEYNLGNTLLGRAVGQKDKKPKLQDLKNAVQHYDQVLRNEPGQANAAWNRDLAQKLIADLEKAPPPDPKKDQPKQDKPKQDQKKPDQQKKDQPPQDKPDQDGPKQPGPNDPQPGEDDQKKDGDPAEGKPGSENSPPKPGAEGEPKDQPPAGNQPEQPDKRDLSGKLADNPRDAEPKPGEPGEKEEGRQAQEDQAAAADGKMTLSQANALLDSLKGSEDHVSLLNPAGPPPKERSRRDW